MDRVAINAEPISDAWPTQNISSERILIVGTYVGTVNAGARFFNLINMLDV